MIEDFALCASAVKKNKFSNEPAPLFSVLAPRGTFYSSEKPNWPLAHLHNRKPTGEPFQNQRRIDLDSPDSRIVTSQQIEARTFLGIAQTQNAAFALLDDTSQFDCWRSKERTAERQEHAKICILIEESRKGP